MRERGKQIERRDGMRIKKVNGAWGMKMCEREVKYQAEKKR